MRNDAHDDIDDLPKLSTERVEPQLNIPNTDDLPLLDNPVATPANSAAGTSNKAIGALSAVTLAIVCSAAAFGWWSMQRIELLEQQLIATQDSFSRISEDAAGRISEITGKVSATQSNVLSDTQTLKKRLDSFESTTVETHKQQQIKLTDQAAELSTLNKQLASLNERTNSLNNSLNSSVSEHKAALLQQEKALTAAQAKLNKELTEQQQKLAQLEQTLQSNQQQLAQLAPLNTDLQNLSARLTTLQKSSDQSDEIKRLQQDLLILRSELEQRPAAAPNTAGPSVADFDAYRAQTNRTINTLQQQVRNLQKNTP